MCVLTKKRKGMKAVVLMATPCAKRCTGGWEEKVGFFAGSSPPFLGREGGKGGLAVGGRRHFDDDVYYIFAGD